MNLLQYRIGEYSLISLPGGGGEQHLLQTALFFTQDPIEANLVILVIHEDCSRPGSTIDGLRQVMSFLQKNRSLDTVRGFYLRKSAKSNDFIEIKIEG